MKKIFIGLFVYMVSMLSYADLIGENASYELNLDSSRTSWLIQEGEGTATVQELRNDPKIGPAYVVRIDYSLNIVLRGKKEGSLGLLVPAAMFTEQFYEDLKVIHPKDVGMFSVDYLGMSRARDGENNSYDQCMMLKFFNVDPDYSPISHDPQITVLWHESTLSSVENLVLNVKRHATVPVLGAVQIDLSGTVHGINFKAGLDYAPSMTLAR